MLPGQPGPAPAAARKPPAAALPLGPQWNLPVATTLLVASPIPSARFGLVGPYHRGGGYGAERPGTLTSRDRRDAPPHSMQWAGRAVPSPSGGGLGRGVRTRPLRELLTWCAQWAGRASPTRSGGSRELGIWTRPLISGETEELNVVSPCGAQWAYRVVLSQTRGGWGGASGHFPLARPERRERSA